ncbi:MAG TPA: hypothetical protein VGJ05_21545 [Fimbriiglobus sp.]|jgi:uncharacterized membrane protein
MSTTVFNGRQPPQQQRKQLSDQLDRFDHILDGLADGLQAAITDAAREGSRLAVREVIQEVLADPALRAVLAKLAAPIPTRPTVWSRIKATLARLKVGIVHAAAPVVVPVTERVKGAVRAARHAVRTLGFAWQLKKMLAIGAGIGLAVMGVSYISSHGVAAVISGIGGAITAVAVQAGLWFRRSFAVLRIA